MTRRGLTTFVVFAVAAGLSLWRISVVHAQQYVTSAGVRDLADGTVGSSTPSTGSLFGGRAGGNLQPITLCNSSFQGQMTTATTTQFVALSGTTQIRVCDYQIQGSTSATATTFKLVAGTGTNCGTVTATLTPAWTLAASNSVLNSDGGGGMGEIFQTPAGSALCGTNSAAGTVNIRITYTQF